MMLKQKSKTKQAYRRLQALHQRRRLRQGIIKAAARFLKQNPQWSEYFFDLRFLLNRALPIVEKHVGNASSNSAINLALAWAAEEWPPMNASQRKVCLQAQTVIAAELLELVIEEMVLPHPPLQEFAQERMESWRGVGVPLAYVQSHNPPRRSDMPRRWLETNRQQRRQITPTS